MAESLTESMRRSEEQVGEEQYWWAIINNYTLSEHLLLKLHPYPAFAQWIKIPFQITTYKIVFSI